AVLSQDDLFAEGGLDILGVLVKGGLCPSRSEARRAVEQGGVTVNGDKVTDTKAAYTDEELTEGLLVRRGKKSYKKVVLKK
ncbi:MAG: tyrosine--tRNA ligase, partial [Lachnospiraceae bacterium]|nr:tyrosine--tRNA ligase [Lachnospiraceae bacterium]